ncbi:MAG: rod shape-determining protein [Magnetococcales bacterium]|nr:rod shape-determining protein [Magnetococcales bacterium]
MSTGNDSSSPLYLGIDLGTSQTAIMSNRGAQSLVRSVVGYPKDIIGIRLLNDTRLVGQEAIDKRSYMNLHYPLEDGVLKEASDRQTKAAKELLEYAIKQVQPKTGEQISAILGVPARASVNNKNQLLRIAHELVDFAVVVSEPFMVAYGLGRLTNAIIIDIGAGTIDLCAMKGTVPAPEDQITLLKAGNYVDELLTSSMEESYPHVQVNQLIAKKIKEKHGYVGESTSEMIVSVRSEGRPVSVDLSREIRLACEAILPDILESLEELVTHFDPEDQEEALKNIIIAGGGSRIAGLPQALMNHLAGHGEVHVTCVADPQFAGAAGALKLATELPQEYWSQVGDVIGS